MNIIDPILANHNEDINFKREVCMLWTSKHGVINVSTDDKFGAVDFNFEKAHEEIIQNNIRPNILYMIHTHPHSYARMSGVDDNMLHGWVLGFGIPVMFLIVVDDQIVYNFAYMDREAKKVVQLELFKVKREYIHIPECQLLIDVMYGLSKMDKCPDEVLMHEIKSRLNYSGFNLDCEAHKSLTEYILGTFKYNSDKSTAHLTEYSHLYTDNKITFAQEI